MKERQTARWTWADSSSRSACVQVGVARAQHLTLLRHDGHPLLCVQTQCACSFNATHLAQPLGDKQQVLQESAQLNSSTSQGNIEGGSRHME